MQQNMTLMQSLIQRSRWPMSRDKADTLLLVAACVMVLAPHFTYLPNWSVLICAVLLVWRSWITFRGNRLPPRWLLLPLSIGAMAGVFATYRTFFGQGPGLMMLVLLMGLKLLEMHAKRDVFVVVFLGFFLMLANFFHSQSIGTAALMMAAVVLMLTAQLSFQYTGVVPPLRQRLATGFRIVALAAPLTLIAFVLFPRIEGPLWRLPGDAQAGRTGLSDRMSPGNIARLALSEDIAFRVKFLDPAPEQSRLYWRGPVLGHYDGRTWTEVQASSYDHQVTATHPSSIPVRHEVTLEPHGQRWLLALEMPQVAPAIKGNPTWIASDQQMLARAPIRERIRYEAASLVDYVLEPNLPRFALYQWLQLPANFNPHALAFAARLRSQHSNPVDLANAVLRFFREEKFSYTLEPPALGTHAVDDFLFSTRAGFCEHYASSFVVLMRAAGIPARVITGYQGGEFNDIDGFTVIRQSDAHAWAEIWLEGTGWTRVDPTAAVAPNRISSNLSDAIPPRLLGGLLSFTAGQDSWLGKLRDWRKSWRRNWDAVTNSWNQWVLNYTPDRQKGLLQSLGFTNPDWRTLTLLMLALGLAALAVIAALLLKNRQVVHPVDRLYNSLCQHMARLGYPRALHEGPRAYRNRLTAADSSLTPEKKLAVSRFLDLYETIRYGTLSSAGAELRVPPAPVVRLKSLLSECK